MKIYATIGLGYGDEGKGMWVDYRARTNDNPLVIRANSGAQVGHTVVRDDKRYIFSSLGSGTLAGAPTLFTRYSVVNPILFIKEICERNPGIPYQLFVEGDTPVSTPYDMLLNQATEARRGDNRHGSCGVGFGVTIEREENQVHLHFNDLASVSLPSKIKKVREWCLSQLGEPQDTDTEFVKQVYEYFKNNTMVDFFKDDCRVFRAKSSPWNPKLVKDYDTLIFENGQGLLLDQEYGVFPHVTRSNTGFRNVGKFLKRHELFNKIDVMVDYITRCYTTRHGAGPLPYERDKPVGIVVNDPTNIYNEYQQNLRFAPLNLHDIHDAMSWDRKGFPSYVEVNKIITCCDQIAGGVLKNPNSKTGDHHVVEYVNREGMPKFLTASQYLDFIRSHFNIIVGSPKGPKN